MRSSASRSGRRGAIVVQFAMMALGFFGLAAVVIDVRLASMSQAQMQSAADSAALWSLAHRDAYGEIPARLAAREMVGLSFDDDLTPANGDVLNFGAGPLISLTGGAPVSNASALISVADPSVYDPRLELNTPNEPSGDIVVGNHDPFDEEHVEFGDLTRTDFDAVPDTSDPWGSVLVRLRRTTNANGLDVAPDVASSGPSVPFLFALGTSMHGDSGSAYNPRTDGLSVRATAIAAERRAVEIAGPGPAFGDPALQTFVLFSSGDEFAGGPPGQPFPPPGQFGATPPNGLLPPGQTFTPPNNPTGTFQDIWDDLEVGEFFQADVDEDGFLIAVGLPGGGTDRVVGYFAENPGPNPVPLNRVGQFADLALPAAPSVVDGETFVTIARSIGGAVRAVGFGFIEVTSGVQPGGGLRIGIRKLKGGLRARGPNATNGQALLAIASVPQILTGYSHIEDPVTAPVLVR